ncbi:unnamed protein product [Pleuronectes platessa]|uniref:Uncharacterized protein n=1 Tax=Pleuronectes platessa TaxID=8262 RepID=A0A9N7U4B0_PLEPL|nr:unnamed protein product [Pleuronectes platessa]
MTTSTEKLRKPFLHPLLGANAHLQNREPQLDVHLHAAHHLLTPNPYSFYSLVLPQANNTATTTPSVPGHLRAVEPNSPSPKCPGSDRCHCCAPCDTPAAAAAPNVPSMLEVPRVELNRRITLKDNEDIIAPIRDLSSHLWAQSDHGQCS